MGPSRQSENTLKVHHSQTSAKLKRVYLYSRHWELRKLNLVPLICQENINMKDSVLLAHVFTGFCGKAKTRLCTLLQLRGLVKECRTFHDVSSQAEIEEAGYRIFSALYTLPCEWNLNQFCFEQFRLSGPTQKMDLRSWSSKTTLFQSLLSNPRVAWKEH